MYTFLNHGNSMSVPTDRPQVSVWIFSGIAQAQEIATLAQYPYKKCIQNLK